MFIHASAFLPSFEWFVNIFLFDVVYVIEDFAVFKKSVIFLNYYEKAVGISVSWGFLFKKIVTMGFSAASFFHLGFYCIRKQDPTLHLNFLYI